MTPFLTPFSPNLWLYYHRGKKGKRPFPGKKAPPPDILQAGALSFGRTKSKDLRHRPTEVFCAGRERIPADNTA